MFGMRPLITRYEYCMLCADSYESKGMPLIAQRYRNYAMSLTVEEAGMWI